MGGRELDRQEVEAEWGRRAGKVWGVTQEWTQEQGGRESLCEPGANIFRKEGPADPHSGQQAWRSHHREARNEEGLSVVERASLQE